MKVLHKMIVYLLCQRATRFDKIQRMECWLLSLFEKKNMGEYANVAWVVAHWLKKKGKGSQSDSELVCGHLITRLAKGLNVFTEENMATYSAPTAYKAFDHVTLRDLLDDGGKLKTDVAGPRIVRPHLPPQARARGNNVMEKIERMESKMDLMERKVDRILYHSNRYALVMEDLGKAHNIDMGDYCPPSISEQVVEDENTPSTHEQ